MVSKNKRSLPWREMFAQHASPYHVWVSEIMLQQTVIKAVIPKYLSFFERFPTVFDLAAAQEEDVRLACQGLGYYRRFKLMHNCAKKLCENKNEKNFVWPGSYKEWLSYPGIGTYTASAISSICLSEAQMVVDGNVERLMCRLHDIRLEPNLAPLKKNSPIGAKISSANRRRATSIRDSWNLGKPSARRQIQVAPSVRLKSHA